MASREEINNQKEYNRLLKEQESIEGRISDSRKGDVNIAFSAIESLKEVLNIRTKNSESERESLKLARQAKDALLGQKTTFAKISDIQKEVSKNQNILNKSRTLQNTLDRQVIKDFDKILENNEKIFRKQSEINALNERTGNLTDEQIEKDILQNEILTSDIARLEEKNKILINNLSPTEQELLFVRETTKELERSNKLREDALKAVAPTAQFLEILGTIPGFSSIASKALEDLLAKTEDAIENGQKQISQTESLAKSIGAGIKAATSPVVVFGAVFSTIVRNALALDRAQTNFKRLTGETAEALRLQNDSLSTAVDLIETQVRLTQQFGINAAQLFPPDTLKLASDLTKAVGLSEESSGRFAQFSKITSDNLEDSLNNVIQSTPKAFNFQKILDQTANVSSDIAVSLGTSVEKIGAAVIEANKLGLSLQQVNDIAGNLLDIESSIQAEFEAEVLTGRQLNLERARFFALTNDLEGLTKEIGNNEAIINSFASSNRIQQEAIAASLGLSRGQMSDMVLQSSLINTLTDEQRANAQGVTVEQLAQLDAQQAFNDTIAKLAQTLLPIGTLLGNIANFLLKSSDYILAMVTGFGAVNAALKIQKRLAAQNLILGKKGLVTDIARMAAKAYQSGALTPFIGPAIGAAAAAGALLLGKTFLSKADDLISPGYGKRTIMGPEGAIALNNNDTIIAGTNLGGRNTPDTVTLSNQQIKQIADAVRDGASRATITMDGGKVSSRLQTPMIVNTLPGV